MEATFSPSKISAQVKVLERLHGQSQGLRQQFSMSKKASTRRKPPEPVVEALHATFIKEWRKHRGMSQTELGDAVGLSTATISQIENAKTGYKQEHLQAIARVLEVHPIDLLVCDPTSHPKGIWSTIRAILA